MYFEYFDYFHIGNRSDVVILHKIGFFSGRWMIRISDRTWRLATRHISQPKRKHVKSKAPMKNHQFGDRLAFNKGQAPHRR